MHRSIRSRMTSCALFLIAMLFSTPVLAQCDISGEWSSVSREDWDDRAMQGAYLGDYTGIPLNDAGRLMSRTWDASMLSLPTQQALPHAAMYSMRGPGPRPRISKVTDAVSDRVVAYTLTSGLFGGIDRTIWLDGRPHPSAHAEHTWDGFSTGECVRGQLKVTTTHMKFGHLRRNGVPASSKSTMTEFFIRHGDHMTIIQFTEDPVYLEEPFVRTTDFVRDHLQNIGPRGLGFEVVEEILLPKGVVPHYPLGTLHEEPAERFGIPYVATQGGKDTTYPEYRLKLRELIESQR